MKKTSIVPTLCALLFLAGPGCKKAQQTVPGGSEPSAAQKAGKSDQPVEFKLKWPAGNRYVQRMDVEQKSETTLPRMPKPMKQDVTMAQEFALSVLKDRPGTGPELEMEFLSAEMEVAMGEQVMMSFDSKGEAIDEGQNPMAAAFRQLIGSRIKYFLNASNKVEKIEGAQDLMTKVTGRFPPQAQAVMGSMFGEEALKQMVEYGQSLPRKPVKPGDRWPVQTEVVMGPLGKAELNLDYTFTGWEQRDQRNCAVLEFKGTMTSKSAGSAPGPMGGSFNIEKGTLSGKEWFDPDLGMGVETSIDQDMTLHITFGGGPGGNPGGRTPMPSGTATNVMKQKITFKLVELAQAAQ